MGNQPGGMAPGGQGPPDQNRKKDDSEEKNKKKKEALAPPSHFGRKKRKAKGTQIASKLPSVIPTAKCRLRVLKHERIKDYLMMEEEFIQEQQRLKPKEERDTEERTKLDDLRGSPMDVGSLEEFIDENHCIVTTGHGSEYYVNLLSFVDRDQLEPGSSILV